MSPKDLIAWAASVRGFGPEDFERLREMGQALERSEAGLAQAKQFLDVAHRKMGYLLRDYSGDKETAKWLDEHEAWRKLREGGKG